MVPGQLCTEVFILITGSLQVTLPSTSVAAGGAVGAEDSLAEGSSVSGPNSLMPCSRTTAKARSTMTECSQGGGARTTQGPRSTTTGRGGAAAALKGERLRFRVVEKPGHIVGLSEPFQPPAIYPFHVSALKTSQMVSLTRQHIADVLSVFHGCDADAVCHVLRSDFLMCWETLKPRGDRGSITTGEAAIFRSADAGLAAKQAQELGYLRDKVSAFEGRLDECIAGLSAVQAQTSVLPQMKEALRALVDAHTSA